jgi:ferritin-like metal-binding protein YciE
MPAGTFDRSDFLRRHVLQAFSVGNTIGKVSIHRVAPAQPGPTEVKGNLMPSTISTVEDLLVEQIRDLYDAEKQLVRALPKMAKAAGSDELRQALEDHLEETTNQVQRLEQAFEELDKTAKGKTCKAMKGLIEEGGEVIEEDSQSPISDLALIAAAQRVEHYEISAYGTAKAMAKHLRQNGVASLLEETEDEEKAADKKLTEIAMGLMQETTSRNNGVGSGEEGEEESDNPPAARKPATAPKAAAMRAQRK